MQTKEPTVSPLKDMRDSGAAFRDEGGQSFQSLKIDNAVTNPLL